MKAMEAVVLFLFIVTFPLASSKAGRVDGKKYETLLLDTIFKDYDKRSRPVEDYHSPLKVNFSISIQQILRVDEKHQVITTNLWRSLFWKDDFLKWNPANYGNISQISIFRSQIWNPIVLLYNSASYEKQIETHSTIILGNDGLVADVLPMILKSTCKIDVKWFPFDEQKCFLVFGSWTVSSKELRFQFNEDTVVTSELVDNGEWKLLGVTAVSHMQTFSIFPNESYAIVTYTIHLKRRAFYYFFNLLVPCGLIGFLAVLGFTLPPESGEKLTLGATILFSLIVFLNMIGESMPATSYAVPLLGTYFNCVMFTIALSVVSTIVINLNLNAVNPKEIQGRSRNFFLYWLPRILRMSPLPNIVALNERMPSSQMKVEGIHQCGHKDSVVNAGILSERQVKQQWKFIAVVVDRLCLILSLLFTFVSVTILLLT